MEAAPERVDWEGVRAFEFYAQSAERPLPQRHSHGDGLEILLVTGGVQAFESDGMDRRMYGKDAFVHQPGVAHTSVSEARCQGECYRLELDMGPESPMLSMRQRSAPGSAGSKAASITARRLCATRWPRPTSMRMAPRPLRGSIRRRNCCCFCTACWP